MKKKEHPRVFRFGKYKGTPVREVIEHDPTYCRSLIQSLRHPAPAFQTDDV